MNDVGIDARAKVPIIIVGVGRSGTSLLHSMLHAHPQLVFLPELHFFRKYVGPPLQRWRWKVAGSGRMRQTLHRDADFHRVELEVEELLSPFLCGEAGFSPEAVYRRLLSVYLQHREEATGEKFTSVGVKDPRLIDYLPPLAKNFPGARILHIIRDPRDVLLSRRRAAWSAGRPDWMHLMTYTAQLARGRAGGARYFGDRYTEIIYEELLGRPVSVLRRVCSQLDVPYSEEMLDFGESARELVSQDEMEWKSETTGPLLRDNTDNWRSALPPAVVSLVDRLCVTPFPDLPYSPAESARRGRLWDQTPQHVLALCSRLANIIYGLRAWFS